MRRLAAPLNHPKTAWGRLTGLFSRPLALIALAARTAAKILTKTPFHAKNPPKALLDAQESGLPRKNEPARRAENHAWIDAARSGDTDALRTLFARNPALLDAIEFPSDTSVSALQFAAASGRTEAVRLLLGWGASVEQQGVSWHDPLMSAAINQNWGAIEALLPVCDPRRKDRNGSTALILAASRSWHPASPSPDRTGTVAQWREFALKSDPNDFDSDGHTALIAATQAGNHNAVEAILPLTCMDAKDHHHGLRAWEWAWEHATGLDDWRLLDLMAAHPASVDWRHEVLHLTQNGQIAPENLPRTLAQEEARVLREEITEAGLASTTDNEGTGVPSPAPHAAQATRRL